MTPALVLYRGVAGEVGIVHAEAVRQGARWRFNVTLRYANSGGDHYADMWRVIDKKGDVLSERVLYHQHQHGQPFSRRLTGVALPESIDSVMIEARDSVRGWATARYTLILDNN